MIKCICGSEDLQYCETTAIRHKMVSRKGNEFVFESAFIAENDTEDPRFVCDKCGEEFEILEQTKISFQ